MTVDAVTPGDGKDLVYAIVCHTRAVNLRSISFT